uniref:alpha-galactosidase n=1 Tax=Bionectria ochroleuca TaxID=29856 RepID=A0A8H7K4H4_BIOOC
MPSTLRLSVASALCATLALAKPTVRDVWQPAVGSKFDITLNGKVDIATVKTDIFDLDLFENTGNTIDLNKVDTSKIDALHNAGVKVICYFSGGSYENWRPDVGSFKSSDLGSGLDGWEGENWLNLKSDNVASIMKQRIAVAARAGCDAIDPDNMDGYDNSNGLGLTEQDTVNFFKNVLYPAAQEAGLALGLKNGGSVVEDVLPYVQFQAGKPVFHIEYPNGESESPKILSGSALNTYCTKDSSGSDITKFSTVLKLMKLNTFTQFCDGSVINHFDVVVLVEESIKSWHPYQSPTSSLILELQHFLVDIALIIPHAERNLQYGLP